MLVAKSRSLVRVNLALGKIQTLVPDAFWGSLYPNSLVVDSAGTIFVGMRHGVARIRKVGSAYRVQWLVPDIGFDRGPLPASRGDSLILASDGPAAREMPRVRGENPMPRMSEVA